MGCSGSKTIIGTEVSLGVPPPPECTQDDNCAHLTTNCGKGVCDEQTSECTVELRPLGSACDVELDCALGRCISGVCSPEIILNCNDNNPCTDDICDMVKGCVFEKMNEGLCNDNNPCTEDDRCTDGVCTAGDYVCDECTDDDGCDQYNDQDACNGVLTCDGATNQCHLEPESISVCLSSNPCMSTVCNVATGLCEEHPRPKGSACSDNNLCSLEDRCSDGQCVGTPLLCPSSDKGCVVTTCAPKSACMDTALHGQPCQDGNQCTNDDVCAEGTCTGTTVETCTCIQDADCALYDDADLCNGQVRCMEGHCLIDPATIPTCTPPGVPCVQVQCVAETGQCASTFTAGPCSDGDLCTVSDQCTEGACIGEPAVCDDANECTSDSCETATGCRFEAIPGCANEPCEDGTSETCNGCGTRTCAGDVWGPCDGGIACEGKECGDDGCDGACGTCNEGDVCIDGQCTKVEECTGECALGETDNQGCGNCGSQTRSCTAQCTWGPWGDCEGQGACSPGATESSGCGNCGSSTRTCNDGCGWDGWSGCGGEGACSPGATESSGCGHCGSSTRTCNNGCGWGGWSDCGGQGPCSPNASQGCGECGDQTCNGNCQWGSCENQGCTPPGPTNCEGCLNGYADCTAACQASGYTTGTCNIPDSTDPGACCGCNAAPNCLSCLEGQPHCKAWCQSILWDTGSCGNPAIPVPGHCCDCNAPSPAPPGGETSKGHIDDVLLENGHYLIRGWACYPGWEGSIQIHLYLGGPSGGGKLVLANYASNSNESGVNSACGVGGGKHRFQIAIDAGQWSGYSGQGVYVHAISPVGDGDNPLISNSGAFTLP